jgi:hypothetical protein
MTNFVAIPITVLHYQLLRYESIGTYRTYRTNRMKRILELFV